MARQVCRHAAHLFCLSYAAGCRSSPPQASCCVPSPPILPLWINPRGSRRLAWESAQQPGCLNKARRWVAAATTFRVKAILPYHSFQLNVLQHASNLYHRALAPSGFCGRTSLRCDLADRPSCLGPRTLAWSHCPLITIASVVRSLLAAN